MQVTNTRKKLSWRAITTLIICNQSWFYTLLIPLRQVLPEVPVYLVVAGLVGLIIGFIVRRSQRALDFSLTVWILHTLVNTVYPLYQGDLTTAILLYPVCATITFLIARQLGRSIELQTITFSPIEEKV